MQALSPTSRFALQVVAACAAAFAMSAAMADEAAQFDDPLSTASRAEVRAEMAQARATGAVTIGEATVFIDQPTTEGRSRDEVRAEGRQAARQHRVDALYTGA